MKNKKNLLVTLADKNYVEQAKQLFSSVYWNAGWKGDYMLLAYEIPEEKLRWFRNKGILVKKCKPIVKNISPKSVILCKFYLFAPAFKKWNNIVYLDTDIIVRASLDNLTKVKGFAAVLDDFIVWRLINQLKSPSKIGSGKIKELKRRYNLFTHAFNAGFFVFNEKIINKSTFPYLKELLKKFKGVNSAGAEDQLVLNLFFYKRWEELPIVYNLDMRDFKFINPKEIKAMILHFPGNYKPWFLKNPFSKEWRYNLERANKIDLENIPCAHKFKQLEIKSYSRYLKKRFFSNFQNLKNFMDYQIGLIGLFLYDNFPQSYFKLKKLKEK